MLAGSSSSCCQDECTQQDSLLTLADDVLGLVLLESADVCEPQLGCLRSSEEDLMIFSPAGHAQA